MNIDHIPYITLWVNRFGEMVDFYKNSLELDIEYEDENFIQFNTSGTKLYIHRIMFDDKQPLRDEVLEIHFSTHDVDQTYEELKQRGVKFEKNPENLPWGRIASFKDPEGFTIELVGPIKESEPITDHGKQ